MGNERLDKFPEWLKSLWHMENAQRVARAHAPPNPLYMLVGTAKPNDIDLLAWLADVLARIAERMLWDWIASRAQQQVELRDSRVLRMKGTGMLRVALTPGLWGQAGSLNH